MKTYYLESSAVIKLFIQEPETKALIQWLKTFRAESKFGFVTSELTRLEVIGKLAQLGLNLAPANQFFASVTMLPIKRNILELAIGSRANGLKTLDAIHHATIQWLATDLAGAVCYDKQLSRAVRNSGVSVYSPGATSTS